MKLRLPAILSALLFSSFVISPSHAATLISWDLLVEKWPQDAFIGNEFLLKEDGFLKGNEKADITISNGQSMKFDGGGHLLSPSVMPATKMTGRAFLNQGNLEVSHCRFQNNFDTTYSWYHSADGGAIRCTPSSTLSVTDCSFMKNGLVSATSSSGGAIFGDINTSITIKNSEFAENYTSYREQSDNSVLNYGGAVASLGKLQMTDCRFSGNYASYVSYEQFVSQTGGGAIYLTGNQASLVMKNSIFSKNYASSHSSLGGAIYASDRSSLNLENCFFEGNYALSNAMFAYGGAIATGGGTATLSNCTFVNNQASSSVSGLVEGRKPDARGGALCIMGTANLLNCSFFDNKVSSVAPEQALGGAVYLMYGTLNVVADGVDSVFQGNKEQSSPSSMDGKANAIRVMTGTVNFNAGNGGKLIFYDNVTGNGGDLNINREQYMSVPMDGVVSFRNGAAIEDFIVNLESGTLNMGEGTLIRGTVNARQNSTFQIDGRTTLDGLYNIHVNTPGSVHTILINMTNDMLQATEENPVWTFTEGSSLAAFQNSLEFVLDISSISIPYDELHPYIFAHESQTEELKTSVNEAKSVRLVDKNGWSCNIKDSFFDYLSGQYAIAPPTPGPGDSDWTAPRNVGNSQSNTMWTTSRSLWSFAEISRTSGSRRFSLKHNTAVWFSGIGNYFTQENQNSGEGYSFRSWGYAAGAEHALTENGTLGMALGQTFGKNDINNRLGSLDQNQIMALLYFNRTIEFSASDRFFFELAGGYGSSNNKGNAVSQDLMGDRLNGSWDDNAWMLDIKTTWSRLLTKKTTFDLYGGLQYTDAAQDSTTLQGNKYKYSLSNGNMNILRGTLGIGLSQTEILAGHALSAYIRTGIIETLDRKIPRVNVRGETRSWEAFGSTPSRTALNVAAGVRIQLSKEWSTGFHYNLETANGSLAQTGNLSLTYEF